MKTKLIIVSLLTAMTFISCKNEPKAEEPKAVEQEKSKTFDISVDLIIPSDEQLLLFYKDGSNQWFQDDKMVSVGVKGKNEVQTVVFNLPEGVIPNDLRFDIGLNEYKGLKSLEIKRFTMSFYGNKFDIAEDQFGTFFKPNQYITFDPATKLYSFKKDEKGNYDAYFETKPEIYPMFMKVASN